MQKKSTLLSITMIYYMCITITITLGLMWKEISLINMSGF